MGIDIFLWRNRPPGLGGPGLYDGTPDAVRAKVDMLLAAQDLAFREGRLQVMPGWLWEGVAGLAWACGWQPRAGTLLREAAQLEAMGPIQVSEDDAAGLSAALEFALALGVPDNMPPWVDGRLSADQWRTAVEALSEHVEVVRDVCELAAGGGFDIY